MKKNGHSNCHLVVCADKGAGEPVAFKKVFCGGHRRIRPKVTVAYHSLIEWHFVLFKGAFKSFYAAVGKSVAFRACYHMKIIDTVYAYQVIHKSLYPPTVNILNIKAALAAFAQGNYGKVHFPRTFYNVFADGFISHPAGIQNNGVCKIGVKKAVNQGLRIVFLQLGVGLSYTIVHKQAVVNSGEDFFKGVYKSVAFPFLYSGGKKGDYSVFSDHGNTPFQWEKPVGFYKNY